MSSQQAEPSAQALPNMSAEAPQPQAANPRRNRWTWAAKLEARKIRKAMKAVRTKEGLAGDDKRKQIDELKGKMAAIDRPRNEARTFPDRKTQRESRRKRAKAAQATKAKDAAGQENPGSSSRSANGPRRVTRSMTTTKPAPTSEESAESSQPTDAQPTDTQPTDAKVSKVARRPKKP